ncbi:hypothetical protein A2U01_0081792, partial [Trifolium medium]|nr:hypothetical protein [Trifolium medium]
QIGADSSESVLVSFMLVTGAVLMSAVVVVLDPSGSGSWWLVVCVSPVIHHCTTSSDGFGSGCVGDAVFSPTEVV